MAPESGLYHCLRQPQVPHTVRQCVTGLTQQNSVSPRINIILTFLASLWDSSDPSRMLSNCKVLFILFPYLWQNHIFISEIYPAWKNGVLVDVDADVRKKFLKVKIIRIFIFKCLRLFHQLICLCPISAFLVENVHDNIIIMSSVIFRASEMSSR